MHLYMKYILLLLLVTINGQLPALDKGMAESLAKSAIALNAQGNTEKARELLFTALANDSNCALALYEISLIFEKEGKLATAGEFLNKSLLEFKKSPDEYKTQLNDGQRRMRKLNPFAERFASSMETYALEIAEIARKQPDVISIAEAQKRADAMSFIDYVPAEKLTHIRKNNSQNSSGELTQRGGGSSGATPTMSTSANTIPFDVERELKQAGWDKITGTWKKVGTNTYEVTNAVLTADKTNGSVGVVVHRGSGRVSVFARAKFNPSSYSTGDSWYASDHGYGLKIEGPNVHRIEPYAYLSSSVQLPSNSGTISLTENYPKNIITISAMQNNLIYYINNKQVRKFNSPIPQDGPFMIRVDGTVTIETPVVRGQ